VCRQKLCTRCRWKDEKKLDLSGQQWQLQTPRTTILMCGMQTPYMRVIRPLLQQTTATFSACTLTQHIQTTLLSDAGVRCELCEYHTAVGARNPEHSTDIAGSDWLVCVPCVRVDELSRKLLIFASPQYYLPFPHTNVGMIVNIPSSCQYNPCYILVQTYTI